MDINLNELNCIELTGRHFTLDKVELPSSFDVKDIKTSKFPELLHIYNEWWLKEALFVDSAHRISTKKEEHKLKGVRPVITFSSDKLIPGDEFIISGAIFKVYKQGHAICKSMIDFSVFNEKSNNVSAKYSYPSSTIRHYLNRWENDAPQKRVFKITKKIPHTLNNANLAIPSHGEIKRFHRMFLNTGSSYWLRERKDEFSGYYVDNRGLILEDSINKIHCICPTLEVIPELTPEFTKLKNFSQLEFDGRLFTVLEEEEGLILCNNPIAVSCYSTGIADTTECNEMSFYLSSEAYEEIEKWTSYLST